MKLLTFTVLTLVGISLSAPVLAQPYEHSGGIRAGYTYGLSYKGFFRHRMNALEIGLGYNSHGLNISGLYEIHKEPFRQNSHWLVYFGGGVFGGRWDDDFSMGLVSVAGIEYTLHKTPLNFGLDWRPMLNAYKNFDYDLLDFGLTIRYRFRL